jgi:hypothetical protein
VVAVLPVLGEPTAAVEPGDGALDDPALGLDDKAFGMIGAFDPSSTLALCTSISSR